MDRSEYFENNISRVSDINQTVHTKRNYIKFKTVVFIMLSIVISMQSFPLGINPINYALIAIASVFNVPLLLILVCSILGSIIGGFSSVKIISLIVFFIVFTIFTISINIKGVTPKYEGFMKLIFSLGIIRIIDLLIFKNLSLVNSIYEILIAAIVYIIFISGIYILINYKEKYLFSKEENMALVLMTSCMLYGISSYTLYDLSLMSIISMSILAIYSYKNGYIFGIISAITSFLILNALTGLNLIYVIIFLVISVISASLSKVNKYIYILVFLANLALLYYTWKNYNNYFNYYAEATIAMFSLIFISRNTLFNFKKNFKFGNFLKSPYSYLLDSSLEDKAKIEIAEVITEEIITIQDKIETREVIKKYITDYAQNKCISCNYRKDCINKEYIDDSIALISSKLENDEEIKKSMLAINCSESDIIIDDIKEIYSAIKLMRNLKKNEENISRKFNTNYKELSKHLSETYKNIKKTPRRYKETLKSIRDELKAQGYNVYEDEIVVDNGSLIEYIFVTNIITDIDKQKKEILKIVSNIINKEMNIELLLNISKSERSKIKLVYNKVKEEYVNI